MIWESGHRGKAYIMHIHISINKAQAFWLDLLWFEAGVFGFGNLSQRGWMEEGGIWGSDCHYNKPRRLPIQACKR